MRSVLIAALVSLAAGLGLGWWVNGLRASAEIAEIQKTHTEALARAIEAISKKERANVLSANKAALEASKRAQEDRADADAARDDLERLRHAASSYLGDAGASAAASDLRATTLAELFGQCSGNLQELARKADAHANDVRLLRDSWPKQ